MIVVDFVVLNWKDEPSTLECLEAIKNLSGAYEKHIIVVDNEGTEDSHRRLSSFPEPLTIVTNERNLGFSGGVNSALPQLKGTFVALVNNDCLVGGDWLEVGLRLFEDRKIGLIGGREFLWNDHNPAYSQANEYTKLPIIDPRTAWVEHTLDVTTERTDLPFITASNTIIRGDLLQSLRGFDDRFFTYYEDVDLCARIIDQGYKVGFNPHMMAWHKGSQSSNRVPYAKVYYSRRNQCLVIAQHFDNWLRRVLTISSSELLSNLTYWIRQAANRSDTTIARAGASASLWLLTHLLGLRRARRRYRRGLSSPPPYYQKLCQFYDAERQPSGKV